MRMLVLVLLLALAQGCRTSSSKTVTFTGIDTAEMYGHWNELVPLMAGDLDRDGKGLHIEVAHSAATGRNASGPFTCDAEGCWHGINYMKGNKHRIFYPPDSPTWVKRHELLHSILLTQFGLVGHPEWVTLHDGRRVRPKDIIRGRWPALIFEYPVACLPGGPRPLDPFRNQWKGLVCGVKE
jgi:hypothetical protein